MKLIKRKSNRDTYTCILTNECDGYLLGLSEHYMTYIEPYDKEYWNIRVPGRSEGYIKVDENLTIISWGLYLDQHSHFKNVDKSIFEKFIGERLEI